MIADYSQWNRGTSPTIATQKSFTQRLIDIFSGQNLDRHTKKDEGAVGPKEIFQYWQANPEAKLTEVVEALNAYLDELNAEQGQAVAASGAQTLAELAANRSVDTVKLAALLAPYGRLLTTHAAAGEMSETARRNSFLRAPNWELLTGGAYADREGVLEKALERFIGFRAKAAEVTDDLKLPLFWIGGRTGDGKSVLMLQLVHRLLAQSNETSILLCNRADDVAGALSALRGAGPTSLVVVVDDLHKVLDVEASRAAIEAAANARNGILLLACGPTPERKVFLKGMENLLAVTPFEMTNMDEDDAAVLSAHLGVTIEPPSSKSPTLVELVFLGLGGDSDLAAFANSLRKRVDEVTERKGLFAELAAFTWMDVPFPASELDAAALFRIEELADETQLHFSEAPGGGYRFGHPAIAKPIFDALTRDHATGVPLSTRLAKTLAPLLSRLPAPMGRFAIRQIAPRLGSEEDLSPLGVLGTLYTAATGATFGAQLINQILKESRGQAGHVLDRKWLTVARTLRDNHAIDARHRADLHSELVSREPADGTDFKAFVGALETPDVAEHLGAALTYLLRRDKDRTVKPRDGGGGRIVKPCLTWIRKFPLNSQAQNVVTGLLAANPANAEVRTAALTFAKGAETSDLASSFVATLSRHLEEESEEVIRKWLTLRVNYPDPAHVYSNLISKSGTNWIPETINWLEGSPRTNGWIDLAAGIVSHLEPPEDWVEVVRGWGDEIAGQKRARQFFVAVARSADRFGAVSQVDDHISKRWPAVDAVDIFASLWPHLKGDAGLDKLHALAEMANSAETKVSEMAASALSLIASSRSRPHLWLPLCIEFVKQHPRDTHSGKLVGSMLQLLGAGRGGQAPSFAELEQEEAWLSASAWHFAGDKAADQASRVFALGGLMDTQYHVDRERIMQTVRDEFYSTVSATAWKMLRGWLRSSDGRSDAAVFLLDPSRNEIRLEEAFSTAVARSLEAVFEIFQSASLSDGDRSRLGLLLQMGVKGMNKVCRKSAWAAWQLRDKWPAAAVPYLWRGVLFSSIVGLTMRRSVYWEEFSVWYSTSRDAECRKILEGAGVAFP